MTTNNGAGGGNAPAPAKVPPRLKRGDTVALITPAGPVEGETLEGAKALLEGAGLKVRLAGDAALRQGYLAGSDERRLSELQGALTDPEVDLEKDRGSDTAGRRE